MNNLILVDQYDNEIGIAEKMAVHKTGDLHRAFSVFIFRKLNNNLQLLLQKRNINKYHSGGLWTNSCCGHPEVNDNIIFSAKRRVFQELGITLELVMLGSFIYKNKFSNDLIEHELDHVLAGVYQNDLINPDPNEIDDFKWENILDFEKRLELHYDEFTVWLKPAWNIVKDNLHLIFNNNSVDIINLNKKYANNTVLNNINLSIKNGSITGFIGKSGAGKTTLLKCLNLLEVPDSGEIIIDGQNILTLKPCNLRRLRKKIGMVFQSFNLLNNRTVAKNIALPLELIGLPKAQIAAKVATIASLVGLTNKLDVYPNNLSGGQKQRVAIARALVCDVNLLLCDEFTSSLDPDTTLEILALLVEINTKLGVTIVIITHDMTVVREICDYVHVIEQGNVIESGIVQEIFYNPKHEITKSLINITLAKEIPNTLKNKLIESASDDCQVMVRLIFLHTSAQKAIISELITSFNISVDIISGHLDHIRNETLGNLLITFKYDRSLYSKIEQFFATHNIRQELLGYLKGI